MFKRFPLFFLCAALFSGCATHPKHTPAAVETAETLGLPASSQPPIAPQWWRALNDAKLDSLRPLQNSFSPDNRNPKHRFSAVFGCFRPQSLLNSTQMPP